MKKTILVLSTLIITMLATTMVAFAGSATLKQDADGNWWYYNNDKLDTTKDGMVDYNGGLFVVIDGLVRKDFMGMCHVEFLNVDKWYFFSQGQVQKDWNGFAEYDNHWFYLNKGELASNANGFYQYGEGLFLVAAGQIKAEYSGLYQNTQGSKADNKWYFLAGGQVQEQYTGLALYDGEWFYLQNGCLAEDYTGYVEYNGGTFYVVNGMVKADPNVVKEGSVLNIYCWNDEFMRRVEDHYPGYVKYDYTTGKIGDVTVNWIITPSMDNAYQNNLDYSLLNQDKASADEKVDIFLVEPDYAKKYVDTNYTMSMASLGISDANVADQFAYNHDIMTDQYGALKGLTWQCCPGALIYNREAAKEVLGTDDPAKVQAYVKDWDSYMSTAKKMEAEFYNMTASTNDTYRVYANNTTSPWVVDGTINIDSNIMNWMDDTKELVDDGCTDTYDMWSDDWSVGFYPDGRVFCYFGPAWFSDFCMAADVEGSVANQGDWGVCAGPEGYFWGGTMLCVANGTDNPTLVKDILLTMTTNQDVLSEIVVEDNDFVNSKTVMNKFAANTSYSSRVLGGQNPLGVYVYNANRIDMSNMSVYDSGCNNEFARAAYYYFNDYYTKEEALDYFYKCVQERYPALNAPN